MKKPNGQKNKGCTTCSDDLADVRSDAFAFCRYTIMLLSWIAFIFRLKWLVVLIFAILVLSAILGVSYAPMIVLYNYSLGLFFKYNTEKLGINGMRFAHALGSILAGLAVLFLYFWDVRIGWAITLLLAIMKTISAIGLCPAYKLYNCMKSGGCCSITKKLSK